MMIKRASVFIGIAVVLLSGFLPAGEACALPAAVHHECCAEQAPEPTSSCCSSVEESQRRAEPRHEVGCDCVHPPSTPVTTVASTRPSGPDDLLDAVLTHDRTHSELPTIIRVHSNERHVRSHPPPPVFLLDCSLLI